MIYGLDLSASKSGVAILGAGISTLSISPKKGTQRRVKLNTIRTKFDELFAKNGEPSLIVVEEPVQSKYQQAVFQIQTAHGVVISAIGAAGFNCPTLYVHAMTLKNLVTGNGKAEKKQMQEAIEKVTGEWFNQDEADAVALALVGRAVGDFDVGCWKCYGAGYKNEIECSACDGSGLGKPDEVNLREIINDKLRDLIYNEFGLSTEGVKEAKRLTTNAKAKERRAKAKVLKMTRTKEVIQ